MRQTLHLKPAQNSAKARKPRFYVWKKGTIPTKTHGSLEDAWAEAQRLAGKFPDDRFRVLQEVKITNRKACK